MKRLLFVIGFSTLVCSNANAAWTLVTSTQNSRGSSGISGGVISATQTVSNVGDAIFVESGFAGNSTTALTLTSELGNVCNKLTQFNWSTIATPASGVAIWYCSITITGSEAMSVKGLSTSAFQDLYWQEYSGAGASGSLFDVMTSTGADTNAGTVLTSVAMTTALNGELIVCTGNITAGAGTLTLGSGFSSLQSNAQNAAVAEFQTQATAGSIAPTFATSSTSQNWENYCAAFKAAAATASPMSLNAYGPGTGSVQAYGPGTGTIAIH